MSDRNRKDEGKKRADMPSAEKVQEELAKAESMDDFFGRDGIFAKLFANTLEQMLEAELSDDRLRAIRSLRAQLGQQPQRPLSQKGAHLRRGR
jgi:hypothetical protein